MYRGELLNFFSKKVVDCFGSLGNCRTFASANEERATSQRWSGLNALNSKVL